MSGMGWTETKNVSAAWDGHPLAPGLSPPWSASGPGELPDDEGAVETMRWRAGALLAWPAHRARLTRTLLTFDQPVPSWGDLGALAAALVCRPEQEHRLRLTVPFSKGGDSHWAMEAWTLPPPLVLRRRGIHAVSRPPPALQRASAAHHKLISRLRALAAAATPDLPAEPLFFDADGRALEGATWNLFAVVDEVLTTPPDTAPLLAGVMRSAVLNAARRLGLRCAERDLHQNDVVAATEVFVTNALLPLAPLCSLDGVKLAPIGPRFRALLEVIDATATP